MILLTGGTGFLGKFILEELLTKGYEVRLLVRNAAERSFPWGKLVEIVDGDILDSESLSRAAMGVDAVIHSAAMVSFWRKDWPMIHEVNVTGTANVVDTCLELGIEKLIHVSSIAAMGRVGKGKFIDEKTPWKPNQARSKYALSKRKAELEVYRGIAEGLNAVMVNPSVILGKADNWKSGTANMFSTVYKGMKVYNQGTNGFVGAEDVAKACQLLLEADVPNGERYLLSAENWTYKKLFTQMAQALGKKPPTWQAPQSLILFAGYLLETLSYLTNKAPLISTENVKSGTCTYHYDGSKIENLGLSYAPVSQVIKEAGAQYLKDRQNTIS